MNLNAQQLGPQQVNRALGELQNEEGVDFTPGRLSVGDEQDEYNLNANDNADHRSMDADSFEKGSFCSNMEEHLDLGVVPGNSEGEGTS